jgi:hypothetical protein
MDPNQPAPPRSLIRIHAVRYQFSTCNRVWKRTAWILIRLCRCTGRLVWIHAGRKRTTLVLSWRGSYLYQCLFVLFVKYPEQVLFTCFTFCCLLSWLSSLVLSVMYPDQAPLFYLLYILTKLACSICNISWPSSLVLSVILPDQARLFYLLYILTKLACSICYISWLSSLVLSVIYPDQARLFYLLYFLTKLACSICYIFWPSCSICYIFWPSSLVLSIIYPDQACLFYLLYSLTKLACYIYY